MFVAKLTFVSIIYPADMGREDIDSSPVALGLSSVTIQNEI